MGLCGAPWGGKGSSSVVLRCLRTAFFHLGTWYENRVDSCKLLGRLGFEWGCWTVQAYILAAFLPQFRICGLDVARSAWTSGVGGTQKYSCKESGKNPKLPLWDSQMGPLCSILLYVSGLQPRADRHLCL